MPGKKLALRRESKPPEEKRTAQQMADDIERFVELGERVLAAAGDASSLLRVGLEKALAPAVRRTLEARITSLEQENLYLREVLVALTADGPLFIDRPAEKAKLDIIVDVRHNNIQVKRAT